MPQEESSTTLLSLSYPRTGKRGVPQQFPRRLYEMLESETKAADLSVDYPRIISWSESGKAFRILNVKLFCSQVLGKYFRTSKLSSFQRNLNLYGFSKLRRGPGTDMYGHPAFVRGQKERLSELRKLNGKPTVGTAGRCETNPQLHSKVHIVPPSPPPQASRTNDVVSPLDSNNYRINSLPTFTSAFNDSVRALPPMLPRDTTSKNFATFPCLSSRGRLDLLTLALEREAFMEQATPAPRAIHSL